MSSETIRAGMAESYQAAERRCHWLLDPTELALDGSAWRGDQLPDAFDTEVGRRLLLAELEFSEWVLRRVEKVEFYRDRSVSRQVAIDLLVREDAPVFRDADGNSWWLVPLSLMRRRTLVNLELRDEDDRPMTMPGIRLTQRLDQSLLLAAAAADNPETACDDELRRYVQTFVAGTRSEVAVAMATLEQLTGSYPAHHELHEWTSPSPPDYLQAWRHGSIFNAAIYRLYRGFSLYAFLRVSDGRHRLLRMSFDEPTDWSYQRSELYFEDSAGRIGRNPERRTVRYRANNPVSRRNRSQLAAALGLQATRVRFQVPGAENAASYHFEITVPQGLRIVRAALVAGRPNDPERHVSTDSIVGHAPTVGLHVIEVPNGSLCRAQVDLRVSIRGWLTTMVMSCWAIFFVLLSVAVHYHNYKRWTDPEKTNVFLLLVTVSAGVAALLGQSDFRGVAARMLSRVRALSTVAMTLPVIVAGLIAYPDRSTWRAVGVIDSWALNAATIVAGFIVLLVSAVWVRTWRDERKALIEESPWDMTRLDPVVVKQPSALAVRYRAGLAWLIRLCGLDRPPPELGSEPKPNYLAELRALGFDTPAVGIRSAESWHERYQWDDDAQRAATSALRRLDTG